MTSLLALDARAIRVAMTAADLRSVPSLARALQISATYAQQIVSGYVPGCAMRARIAELLDVDERTLWRPIPMPAPRLEPVRTP